MLKFKRREVTITNINLRTEMHGETPTPAVAISVRFLIDRAEFNGVMRRDKADADFFTRELGSDLYEPKYGGIVSGIPVQGKFEKSRAKFYVGVNLADILLENATVKTLELDPQTGGMSVMTCKISVLQDQGRKQLQDFMGTPQKFDLSIGKLVEKPAGKQGELPMGEGSPKNAMEAADDDTDAIAADDPDAPIDVEMADGTKATLSRAGEAKKRVRPSRSKAAIAARKAAK